MKPILTFLFVCLICFVQAQTNTFPSTGAAGIGTITPDASSLFEIKSTSKGILIPRMTKTQRDAIATPALGLIIYQTNSMPGFYFYDGTKWTPVSTKGANTSLSNLKTPTAVNVTLSPDSTSLRDLGSLTKAWSYLYLNNGLYLNGALFMHRSATRSTFLGELSGTNNANWGNTGIGYDALHSNTSGFYNTALGDLTLHLNNGNYNVAVGNDALGSNQTGNENTALGHVAMPSNTSGSNNVAIGTRTLFANTTGYSNIAIGSGTLTNNTIKSNLVAIGDSALFNNGLGAPGANDAAGNTAIGSKALYSNTTGANNTAIGFQSLNSNSSGIYNTAIGYASLISNISGNSNTAIGEGSLQANQTGNYNTAIGSTNLSLNNDGSYNVGIGRLALSYNTNGNNNIAIGHNSLYYAQQNSGNIAIGDSTLSNYNDGNLVDYMVAIGQHALSSNTIGYFNTAIGGNALTYTTSGAANTAVGTNALRDNSTGSANTALGANSNVTSSLLSNATALGYAAIVDASNKVRIGNTNVTSIGGQVSWSTFSDGRYKKNIRENIPGLAFIKALRPISYTVDVNELDNYFKKNLNDYGNRNEQDERSAKNAASKTIYNGFIAQEVELAAKKLNYDFSGVDKPQTTDGLYGLRYSDFVVPLVKAVQELSKMNDSKTSTIDSLKTENENIKKDLAGLKQLVLSIQEKQNACSPCTATSNTSYLKSISTFITDNISLEQNIPNPFSKTTVINYKLPQHFTTAYISVTDKNGKTIKQINISGNGKGQLHVDASVLSSGAYQYSLFVNGKLVDTKQMLLTK